MRFENGKVHRACRGYIKRVWFITSKNVLEEQEKIFLDVKTGRFVAIKRWKDKYLVVVFESYDEPTVITVFPTSKINKVMKRVESRSSYESEV